MTNTFSYYHVYTSLNYFILVKPTSNLHKGVLFYYFSSSFWISFISTFDLISSVMFYPTRRNVQPEHMKH